MKRVLISSAIWAGALSFPISLFGYGASFGLVHSGGPILVFFIPALWVLEKCHEICSSGVTLTFALVAQFLGYFGVILAVRALLPSKSLHE